MASHQRKIADAANDDRFIADMVPVDYPRSVRFISPDQLRRINGGYSARLDGPARHVVIRPALPLWEILIMCAVAVAIGVMLAVQL